MPRAPILFLSICISLISSSIIVSCDTLNQKETDYVIKSDTLVYEDYGQKLKPLLSFLELNNENLNKKRIFLIFTNRCNSCVNYTLEEIKADARSFNKEIILVFNKPDKVLEATFKSLLKETSKRIIIDTTDFLEKNGVSFGKNLLVEIDDASIKRWKFY